MFSDTYNKLLPIRPKPLLYPKDSTILTNSRHSSKADQLGCNVILVSFLFLSIISYVSFADKNQNIFSQHDIKQFVQSKINQLYV